METFQTKQTKYTSQFLESQHFGGGLQLIIGYAFQNHTRSSQDHILHQLIFPA